MLWRLGVAATGLGQYFIRQPADDTRPSVKWDGEWQITYETFRDMGIAYAVGMVLIYLLVVAYFRDYRVPLVIMAPIPLTVIGVMPGHALLEHSPTAWFATALIGGIITSAAIAGGATFPAGWLVAAAAVFAAVSVATWAWIRYVEPQLIDARA